MTKRVFQLLASAIFMIVIGTNAGAQSITSNSKLNRSGFRTDDHFDLLFITPRDKSYANVSLD